MNLDLDQLSGNYSISWVTLQVALETLWQWQLIQLLRIDVNRLSRLCTSISRSRSVSGLLFVVSYRKRQDLVDCTLTTSLRPLISNGILQRLLAVIGRCAIQH